MSTALTLARPYARAAFLLASERQCLQAWSQLLGFAAEVAAAAGVKAVLSSPSMDAETAVTLLSPETGSDPEFSQFLRVLESYDRLSLLPEISQLFEQARAESEQVVKVTVTSAVALDEAEVDSIMAALRRRFGRDIALARKIDANLIGGAVIDAGDIVIDGSVRGKLERLRSTLAQ